MSEGRKHKFKSQTVDSDLKLLTFINTLRPL